MPLIRMAQGSSLVRLIGSQPGSISRHESVQLSLGVDILQGQDPLQEPVLCNLFEKVHRVGDMQSKVMQYQLPLDPTLESILGKGD